MVRSSKKRAKREAEAAARAAAEGGDGGVDGEPDAKRHCGDGNTRMYVGGMPYYETPETIKAWFEENVGPVEDVDCFKFPSGDFRGIAIINFKSPASASKCMQYNESEWDGKWLVVKPYEKTEKKEKKEYSTDDAPAPVDNGANSYVAYLGNLHWEATVEALESWLKETLGGKVGSISDVRVQTAARGAFGFAEFESFDKLKTAMTLMKGAQFWGRPVKVMQAKSRVQEAKPDADGTSIMVRRLNADIATPEKVRAHFDALRPVDVYIPRGKTTFAFVRFANNADAKKALKFNLSQIEGQTITVQIAAKGRN